MLEDKGQDKINDHRTAERKKRQIDKIHSNGGGPDT